MATGQSPLKIFSIGYDYLTPHTIEGRSDVYAWDSIPDKENIGFNGGLRIGGNLPVVNAKRWSLNIGYYFRRSTFKMPEDYNPPYGAFSTGYYSTLKTKGLNTAALNFSLFVPLNNRHFIVAFSQGEVSGDYNFKEFWNRFNNVRGSYSVLFGWKKKPNKVIAVGVARTWRGGTAFFNPVLLWNQTFNERWGVELLLPARGFVRYNFSPRSLLLLGYELEGSSYTIKSYYNSDPQGWFVYPATTLNNAELRRSELRARLTWEKQIYKFIWFSLQGGVRINYGNKLAFDDNQPKGEYVMKAKLPWTPFAFASVNLVVPPK